MEPNIGDRVRATMNGSDWFEGVLIKESDTLAQYGVLRDDIKEVRYFTHAKKIAGCALLAGYGCRKPI